MSMIHANCFKEVDVLWQKEVKEIPEVTLRRVCICSCESIMGELLFYSKEIAWLTLGSCGVKHVDEVIKDIFPLGPFHPGG